MFARESRQPGPTLTVLTLLALLSGGCERSIPTSPVADAATPRSSLDEQGEGLPFHFSGEAVFLGRDLARDFGPPNFGKSEFDGRCSVPSDFVIRFSIAGQATHMGDVTASDEHCSVLDFATGRTLSDSDGEMTITAANGDELWVRYHRSPGEQAHPQFTGGTGRFTGASGEATMQATCDRAAGTCVLEIEGVLAYDASQRSQ